jgi:succinate dehydrogenase/fumarate reductase cytochrome b subunit
MERGLARLQAVTGLVFAVFLTVHLVALCASALGPGWYDGVQRSTAVVYRAAPYEWVLLLLPLVVHVVVGVVRMRRRPRRTTPLPWAVRLHRQSAWLLLAVIFGHVGATRGLQLAYDVDCGFAGVSFAMAWMPGLFSLYYSLLAIAGLIHGVYGVASALAVLGVRVPPPTRVLRRAALPLVVIGLLAIAGVASFAGWLYAIPDPLDNDYARVYRDVFGVGGATGKRTP